MSRRTRTTLLVAPLTLCLAALAGLGPREAAAQAASRGSAVPCAVPLAWRIARVDVEFGLEAEEVTAVVQEAAELWEDGTGRSLFRHDAENGFPVRVVYDERQAELGQRIGRQRELEAVARELEVMRGEVLARGERLAARVEDHRERALEIQRRIAEHNETVREANAGGGASPERRAELEAVGEALRGEQATLTAERPALEAEEASLREAEASLNARIAEHGRLAAQLASSFPAVAVEAGEYRERVEMRNGRVDSVSREIRLYRFQGVADLRAVAAHELGHALGLGHTSDAGSVMSPEASGDAPPTDLSASDRALLESVCPRDAR